MVAVSSGKVLVTGASGYLGAWAVKYLVDEGYSVVAAVRTAPAGKFITSKYHPGKVSAVLVADIEKEGAYDEAVRGVDAILHMASPVQFSWEDPQEVLGPAVKGATGILKSAKAYGLQVKRVVITSSAVAMIAPGALPDGVYDESHWNTSDVNSVNEQGKSANPWIVYNASKTLAEQAAWDFIKDEKPPFDLVAMAPVFNFGPILHDASGSKGIGSTPGIFVSMFGSPDTSGSLVGDWVDVRDSAFLHILALKTPNAAGERIVTAADSARFAWQDLYDVLNEFGFKGVPKGSPGAGYRGKTLTDKKGMTMSNGKAKRLFSGFKFHNIEESVAAMGRDLKALRAVQ